MNKLQKAKIYLLSGETGYRFYAELLMQFNIVEDEKISTMGVNITNKINLIYNPKWFDTLTTKQAALVLAHECEHILKSHIPRSKKYGNKLDSNRANMCMDAVINVGNIGEVTEQIGGVTIEKLNELFSQIPELKDKTIQLEHDRLWEYHYNILEQNNLTESNYQKIIEATGEGNSHKLWEQSTGSSEKIEAITRNAVNNAAKKCAGNLTSDQMLDIEKLNSKQVNWKQELRNFVANSISPLKKNTRTKRNKRYGFIQPGKKRERKLKLAVAIDTSGSVSDKALAVFWSELERMMSPNTEITVIIADYEIKEVYPFNKGMKPRLSGRGGTQYNNALVKAVELDVDGVIYFGDGDCADTPENPKIPTLWVFVGGNTNRPGDFGKLISIQENYE